MFADLGDPPHLAADLADPTAPARLVAQARDLAGPLSGLVVNHARSSTGSVEDVAADELDRSFAVDARAAVLLTHAFAAQHDPASGPASVVLRTSGQPRGPMPGELAYVLNKGAVQQVTPRQTAVDGRRSLPRAALRTSWPPTAGRAAGRAGARPRDT